MTRHYLQYDWYFAEVSSKYENSRGKFTLSRKTVDLWYYDFTSSMVISKKDKGGEGGLTVSVHVLPFFCDVF